MAKVGGLGLSKLTLEDKRVYHSVITKPMLYTRPCFLSVMLIILSVA